MLRHSKGATPRIRVHRGYHVFEPGRLRLINFEIKKSNMILGLRPDTD